MASKLQAWWDNLSESERRAIDKRARVLDPNRDLYGDNGKRKRAAARDQAQSAKEGGEQNV